MTAQKNTVSIRILDIEYQVNCPPTEQGALLQSAQFLDKRMREIRKSGHVIGNERTAIMAALNISYDLLMAETAALKSSDLDEQLLQIDQRVSSALAQFSKKLPQENTLF